MMNTIDHFDQKVGIHWLIILISRCEFQMRNVDAYRQNGTTLENKKGVSLCHHQNDVPHASVLEAVAVEAYKRCKRVVIRK